MQTWSLGASAISSLVNLPETGMGFQLVEAVVLGMTKPLLVLNADHAIDIAEIGLEFGDDPSVILRNGLRIMDTMNSGIVQTMFAAPQPHSFKLLGSRISLPQIANPTAGGVLMVALPSSLVKHVSLPANRVFHRFSAFNPDRRVDPKSGSLLPGTYVAPESEIPFVPTGFTAVGRFALPNNLPASHHYVIEAPAGTSVDFGTVAPAFGQAGGGVEAYFKNAVTNAQVPPTPASKLPDE
jgi:hypothetical protein